MQMKNNFFSALQAKHFSYFHWAFLILVLILLMILSSFHQIGGFNVETDFYGSYAPNVKNMLHGGRYYDEDHGPGYIFPLIFFYLIIGDIFIAGKLLSIISTVLFLLFTFLTLKILFNAKQAFLTSLLLFIIVMRYSILASTDMFFAFITSLSVYLLFRSGEITKKNLIWTGIATGYAFMTRLNAIIIPVALIFSLIFINSPEWNWRERFKGMIYFLLAMVIGSMPWFIMNMLYYGKPFVSAAHETIGASLFAGQSSAGGDFAWGAEKAKVAKQYHSMFSFLIANLPLLIKTALKNIPIYFQWMLAYLIGFPGLLLVAPGAILLLARANKTQLSFLTIPLFGFLIYTIVSFITRFYIYVINYFVLFIIYFLYNDSHLKLEKKSYKKFKLLAHATFLIVILFSIQKSKDYISQDLAQEPRHIPKIAELLKFKSAENDAILARKPHIGYLSNRRVEVFPQASSIDELITYCRNKGIRFIYYGIMESKLRPELSILQQPEKLPPDLALIYEQNNPNVHLYEIK